MIIGRVCGNLVSSCKWETLSGHKLLIVEPLDCELNASGPPVIAVDTTGAGCDEIVLMVESREATLAFEDVNTPADLGITGIIDEIKIGVKSKKTA